MTEPDAPISGACALLALAAIAAMVAAVVWMSLARGPLL